jgi:hypothetical protein
MSRPRVNGPRSLIVTTVDTPVCGLVTLTLVPNGSLRCAAVRPSRRNAWPLAVCLPELYWVAFMAPSGQVVDPAIATLPNPVVVSIAAAMSLIIFIAVGWTMRTDGSRVLPISVMLCEGRKSETSDLRAGGGVFIRHERNVVAAQ